MKWIGSRIADIWPFEYSEMSSSWICSNRKWRHSIRQPRKPYPRTKHEVDRMTRGDMAIRNSISWRVYLRPPFFREGEVVEGRRSYHSKERWWFPTGSPLWPLHCLRASSHNLPSNVCVAQFDRGWVTLGQNVRAFPLDCIPEHDLQRQSERPCRLSNRDFLKTSNLCDHDYTSTSRIDGHVGRQTTLPIPR